MSGTAVGCWPRTKKQAFLWGASLRSIETTRRVYNAGGAGTGVRGFAWSESRSAHFEGSASDARASLRSCFTCRGVGLGMFVKVRYPP